MRAKKSLGQNFITDSGLIYSIVEAAGVTDEDKVLEIGPGRGALTDALCQSAKFVTAVELDQDLIGPLRVMFKLRDNVKIVNEDILKYDVPDDINIIVGNLPYYITTPIILGLFEKGTSAKSMTFMVQKEVAERIVSGPGSKDYGVLSISVQYYAEPTYALDVPAEYFTPRPKVDSAVVNLKVRETRSLGPAEEKGFFELVKKSFSQRRKTLANSLVGYKGLPKEEINRILESLNIDAKRRPETLSQDEFISLYRAFN